MNSSQRRIQWILRISLALCFIGHGAFGLITKSDWLPYFAVASISPKTAYFLMPLIGLMDVSLAFCVLFQPLRGLVLYMAFWALWTAALRPLAGQGMWEFWERAGNYGVPITWLILGGMASGRQTFSRLFTRFSIDQRNVPAAITSLRITTALLLIGHGGFGVFMHKKMLLAHFATVGLHGFGLDPFQFLSLTGFFEMALGLAALFSSWRPLFLFIFLWKIFTESLYPLSGAPIWEFVERFGSYGAPLALFYLLEEEIQVLGIPSAVGAFQ